MGPKSGVTDGGTLNAVSMKRIQNSSRRGALAHTSPDPSLEPRARRLGRVKPALSRGPQAGPNGTARVASEKGAATPAVQVGSRAGQGRHAQVSRWRAGPVSTASPNVGRLGGAGVENTTDMPEGKKAQTSRPVRGMDRFEHLAARMMSDRNATGVEAISESIVATKAAGSDLPALISESGQAPRRLAPETGVKDLDAAPCQPELRDQNDEAGIGEGSEGGVSIGEGDMSASGQRGDGELVPPPPPQNVEVAAVGGRVNIEENATVKAEAVGGAAGRAAVTPSALSHGSDSAASPPPSDSESAEDSSSLTPVVGHSGTVGDDDCARPAGGSGAAEDAGMARGRRGARAKRAAGLGLLAAWIQTCGGSCAALLRRCGLDPSAPLTRRDIAAALAAAAGRWPQCEVLDPSRVAPLLCDRRGGLAQACSRRGTDWNSSEGGGGEWSDAGEAGEERGTGAAGSPRSDATCESDSASAAETETGGSSGPESAGSDSDGVLVEDDCGVGESGEAEGGEGRLTGNGLAGMLEPVQLVEMTRDNSRKLARMRRSPPLSAQLGPAEDKRRAAEQALAVRMRLDRRRAAALGRSLAAAGLGPEEAIRDWGGTGGSVTLEQFADG